MTVILLWILRVLVVLFLLRLLLRAIFPRGIAAPGRPAPHAHRADWRRARPRSAVRHLHPEIPGRRRRHRLEGALLLLDDLP